MKTNKILFYKSIFMLILSLITSFVKMESCLKMGLYGLFFGIALSVSVEFLQIDKKHKKRTKLVFELEDLIRSAEKQGLNESDQKKLDQEIQLKIHYMHGFSDAF